MYYRRNGKKISISRPITDDILFNDTIYPAPIHPTHFGVLGITEHADPVYPDSRTHTWSWNPDGSGDIIASERPLAEVKTEHKRRLRSQMMDRLDEKYDLPEAIYRLTRGIKLGAADPQFDVIYQYQVALKQAFDTAVAAVDAAATVQSVVAVTANWPPV